MFIIKNQAEEKLAWFSSPLCASLLRGNALVIVLNLSF